MFSAESFDEYKDIHDENEKIVKELERLSMDEKFVDEYINWENVQKKLMNSYRMEAYDDGLAEGEHNKSIEIAKKMLAKKTDIEYISEITGLSIDEINTLKQE